MEGKLEAVVAAKLARAEAAPPSWPSWRRETDIDALRYGSFEYVCSCGRVLHIEEGFSSTGTRVWDTAVAMARMFEKRGLRRGTRVLELGAGTGLLGMALAALGARVICTDTGRIVSSATKSCVDANGLQVEVRELDWSEPHLEDLGTMDLVVASDVLICRQWATQLSGVLRSIGAAETFVGTAQGREGISAFLAAVDDAFHVARLPPEAFHPDYISEDIVVFRLEPRSMKREIDR